MGPRGSILLFPETEEKIERRAKKNLTRPTRLEMSSSLCISKMKQTDYLRLAHGMLTVSLAPTSRHRKKVLPDGRMTSGGTS